MPPSKKRLVSLSVQGTRRDLPTRSMSEARAERELCFARAWAQKEKRVQAGKVPPQKAPQDKPVETMPNKAT